MKLYASNISQRELSEYWKRAKIEKIVTRDIVEKYAIQKEFENEIGYYNRHETIKVLAMMSFNVWNYQFKYFDKQEDGSPIFKGYYTDVDSFENFKNFLNDFFKDYLEIKVIDEESKLTPKEIERKRFIEVLINEFNLQKFLDKKYSDSELKEKYFNYIMYHEIQKIFALFYKSGYREKITEFFTKKEDLIKFLSTHLSYNKRDIAGFWNVLEANSIENKGKYNTKDYLKDIPIEFE